MVQPQQNIAATESIEETSIDLSGTVSVDSPQSSPSGSVRDKDQHVDSKSIEHTSFLPFDILVTSRRDIELLANIDITIRFAYKNSKEFTPRSRVECRDAIHQVRRLKVK